MTSLQPAVISFDRTAPIRMRDPGNIIFSPALFSFTHLIGSLSSLHHRTLSPHLRSLFCFPHSTSPFSLSDAAAHPDGGSSGTGMWRSESAPRIASPTFHPLHVGPLPALICSHGRASRCGSGCARARVSWGLSATARRGRDGRYKRGGFVPTMRCRVATHQ